MPNAADTEDKDLELGAFDNLHGDELCKRRTRLYEYKAYSSNFMYCMISCYARVSCNCSFFDTKSPWLQKKVNNTGLHHQGPLTT
jgi:hypothetical protein